MYLSLDLQNIPHCNSFEYKLTMRMAAARVTARSALLCSAFNDIAIRNGFPIVPEAR